MAGGVLEQLPDVTDVYADSMRRQRASGFEVTYTDTPIELPCCELLAGLGVFAEVTGQAGDVLGDEPADGAAGGFVVHRQGDDGDVQVGEAPR